ncbi:porin family protein [candidate division KSB1 bacterium]|nr:porin family protein [candidate division KSB1 bacterium]
MMGRTSLFIRIYLPLFIFLSLFSLPDIADANERPFNLGIKLGLNKLEGDWKEPKLNPQGSLYFSYDLVPYFGIGGELNYSILKTKSDMERIGALYDSEKFKVVSIPFEIKCRFNFFPFSRVNPFATIGGGVIQTNAFHDNETIAVDGQDQKGSEGVLSAGGGLEFRLPDGLALSIGADYRQLFTDKLDQLDYGDESDGLISVWGGLGYYFGPVTPDDADGDCIPKELDLDPAQAEDRNGYLDHDGVPESGMASNKTKNAPIVIHHPVFTAEAGQDLKISAKILTNSPLRTAAVLYRKVGKKNWNVQKLEPFEGAVFSAKISGDNITEEGMEYCVVAVDERVKGIGYSGLPTRPIRIKVVKNGSGWRIASGIAAVLSWGAASYIVFRKQN